MDSFSQAETRYNIIRMTRGCNNFNHCVTTTQIQGAPMNSPLNSKENTDPTTQRFNLGRPSSTCYSLVNTGVKSGTPDSDFMKLFSHNCRCSGQIFENKTQIQFFFKAKNSHSRTPTLKYLI